MATIIGNVSTFFEKLATIIGNPLYILLPYAQIQEKYKGQFALKHSPQNGTNCHVVQNRTPISNIPQLKLFPKMFENV